MQNISIIKKKFIIQKLRKFTVNFYFFFKYIHIKSVKRKHIKNQVHLSIIPIVVCTSLFDVFIKEDGTF